MRLLLHQSAWLFAGGPITLLSIGNQLEVVLRILPPSPDDDKKPLLARPSFSFLVHSLQTKAGNKKTRKPFSCFNCQHSPTFSKCQHHLCSENLKRFKSAKLPNTDLWIKIRVGGSNAIFAILVACIGQHIFATLSTVMITFWYTIYIYMYKEGTHRGWPIQLLLDAG